MNKKHWNTVTIDGSVPRTELLKMIDHSFEQVVRGLKTSERQKLRRSKNKIG
jgi:predicted DNA-binding protein (MmcQ/YjbR family)